MEEPSDRDPIYRHPRAEELAPGPTSRVASPSESLDVATVLKVFQSVSGEIVLERLIETLLRTAVEQSGAERGLLILPQGDELQVQAEATIDGNSVTIIASAPVSSAAQPETVIQYVARTQENVILDDDASAQGPFSNDEYFRRTHAQSILCLPLVKHGRLIAVLYLENKRASNAFTPARIAVLNVLASAAAISLENSRLYGEVQERESKIRRLVDANIVGVSVTHLDGRIIEANDAFLKMLRYTREDLTSGRLRWTDLTPPEWDAATERALAQLKATGTCELFEKEYFRSDGTRVPVLVAIAALAEARGENVAYVLDLTERKRAQEDARRSEKELRDLIAEMPAMAFSVRPDGSNEFASRRWQEYTGSSDEESAGRGWEATVHPDDFDLHLSKWRASLESGEPFENEVRHRAVTGEYRWFLARAVPLLDEHRRIVKWYGILTDIEDLKRAQEAREEIEEQWRAAFESNPTMYFIVDAAGMITLVNPFGAEQLGYRVEELLGRPVLDIFYEPDRAAIQQHAQECFVKYGQIVRWEARKIRKNGAMLWVRETAKAVFLKKRPVLLVVCEDITEQKRAEDALQRNEAYLAEAQKLTRTGSWAWSPTTRETLYWSDEMFRMFALDPEQGLPSTETFWQLVHPQDRDGMFELMRNAVKKEISYEHDHRIVLPDGTVKQIHAIGHPIRDQAGNVVEYVGTSMDVTERKRAEDTIRRSEAYLAEAQRLSRTGSWAYNPVTEKAIYWSEEEFRIFGLDPQTSVPPDHAWFTQIMHPEDRDRFHEIMKRSFRDQVDFAQDYRIVLPDGTVRHIHEIGHPVRNENGDLVEYVGTSVDVTERKRAEDTLRRSEAYLAEAQRMTRTGSWAYSNAIGKAIYWSEETFRIFGLDPRSGPPDYEEIVRLTHPEDRARFRENTATVFREKCDFEQDYRLVLPDGTIKHIHEIGHPVREETGEVTVFVGTAMDVTERKRAEASLRRSEAYLAESQKLTKTGSWAFDPTADKTIYWSEELFQIAGFDPREGLPSGEELLRAMPPEDRDRFIEQTDQFIRGKKDYALDHRIVLPDGTLKYLHVTGHPVLNDVGEIVEIIGTSMDVTEQVQNREALEKAFEEIKTLKDQLYKENLALRDEVVRTSMFEEIVGASSALQAVLARVARVGPTDSTVLITGETGTGKELIARAIHKRSRRSGRAFVSVNCAALAPSLISSELFGHEKGAFTGATQRRMGRFELADGGTIFLDEVGELPPETQVALLRVLQEREFERVGGTQSVQVDVRVIAATNRDLKAAIANGTFRQDLYYRLNVFPIGVPALRERKDDILMLVEYFVQRYARTAGKQIRSIDKETVELFRSYEWPGNIRELQNVVERSVILTSGDVLRVDESWLSTESPPRYPQVRAPGPSDDKDSGERQIIEAALAGSRGRIAGPKGAAAKLGIPPSTLEYKIKALKIRKSQFKFS